MRFIRKNTVYQLTFLPRFFPVNCYLIEEDEELTLIDAALPYSAKGILKAAEDLGKPITRILLTHAHEDHVGALDALKTESSECVRLCFGTRQPPDVRRQVVGSERT